jgi:hypothetical protein
MFIDEWRELAWQNHLFLFFIGLTTAVHLDPELFGMNSPNII